MNISPSDIKVKIKLIPNSEKTLAQATVTLFDCWVEHGWRVMKSEHLHPSLQEYIWIQSPCFRAGPTWKEMVFIEDRQLYEKLQIKIYDAYHMAKTKETYSAETQEVTVDGDPLSKQVADEIPF